jgi:hypothetical protein
LFLVHLRGKALLINNNSNHLIYLKIGISI